MTAMQGNIAPNIAAVPKTEPQVNQAGISSKPDTSSLTFTIQYNIPQAAEATVQPPKEKEPEPVLAFDNAGAKLNMEIGTSSTFLFVPEPPKPIQPKPVSQIKPILEPVDPLAKDPTKDTFTLTTAVGSRIEVPTIITGGYDFDRLLCLFCERQQFKNDKTLINHLLNHFGVAPKMATCPICGLFLQKKSFARHVRLHGDVKPEVCSYCKKNSVRRDL